MAKPTRSTAITEEVLKAYDAVIATVPSVERKGDTVPYTSLNGHMFSYISKEGVLALRIPKDILEGFLKKYKTQNSSSYGIVQKEYADVPPNLLKKTADLAPYFQASYGYVRALKPKASAKKAK